MKFHLAGKAQSHDHNTGQTGEVIEQCMLTGTDNDGYRCACAVLQALCFAYMIFNFHNPDNVLTVICPVLQRGWERY